MKMFSLHFSDYLIKSNFFHLPLFEIVMTRLKFDFFHLLPHISTTHFLVHMIGLVVAVGMFATIGFPLLFDLSLGPAECLWLFLAVCYLINNKHHFMLYQKSYCNICIDAFQKENGSLHLYKLKVVRREYTY